MNTAATFDVDFSQAGALGNAFLDELNQLREMDPVHWSDASGCWIVTRHQDVLNAFQDKYPLSLDRLPLIAFKDMPLEERAAKYPNLNHYLNNWIINLDPPSHTRLRKLLMQAFSKKVVEAQRPFVKRRVAELMDVLRQKAEIEFNEEIARKLPGSVILDMIGLSQDNLPRLKGWANAFVEGIGVPFVTPELLQRVERAMTEINEVLMPELESRKTAPQKDLLTALVQATDAGDTMSVEEMLGALHVLIVAGHDSTANTLTLSLAALTQHPDAWQYMYEHPEKMLDSCLELMRYIAMSAAQPRIVAEDFEWHGKKLCRGDVVFLMMAAGNRDPRQYANPETLDLTRNND